MATSSYLTRLALGLILGLAGPLSLWAQQDTTWRVQHNQRTILNHEGADADRTPAEVRKLNKADELRVFFRLSELMPKVQTIQIIDDKKHVIWEREFTKITESKPPMVTGAELIKAASKTKLKLFGRVAVVVSAAELMRPCVLGYLQIRAVER